MSSAQLPSAPESLLVVRLGAMGDVVHTLYAVSALRSASPEMRIGWAIEERWAELLCAKTADCCGPRSPSRPVVDEVYPLNIKSLRHRLFSRSAWSDVATSFRGIRSQRYKIAADFQGAIKSALIARFASTQATVGMESPRERPARLLYGQRVPASGTHVIEQYRSLAEAVANEALAINRPEFPRDGKAEAAIAKHLGNSSPNLVILNPGAGWGAKQWPAERYGEVAAALAADGMNLVVNFSPAERDLALRVEAASAGAAMPMACSIGELIAITRRARLFIGGDTGPLHLAAALGVPVVALFGPTDPARNGPYGTQSAMLRNPASRTSLSHVVAPDAGLQQITANEVSRAARQLLEGSHA